MSSVLTSSDINLSWDTVALKEVMFEHMTSDTIIGDCSAKAVPMGGGSVLHGFCLGCAIAAALHLCIV